MATHNQVRVVGYILNEPIILNEGQEGNEKILFNLRTTHRDIDNYNGAKYQDLAVLCDNIKLMPKLKKLGRFDLIDIKGVFNIMTLNKRSRCPNCGTVNIKYQATATFVYPLHVTKLNAVREAYEHDESLPELILLNHFEEVSNQVLLIGTVVSDPEMIGTEKHPCCRYRLGVDRKYYIKSQSDNTADYPWVYSYGKQARFDHLYLQKGAVIFLDAFIQTRPVKATVICSACGDEYTFPDVATEFIPYSVEYLSGFKTDEEIEQESLESIDPDFHIRSLFLNVDL